METINVDKDVFTFLKCVYFKKYMKNEDNILMAAFDRAYLDMCRTIRYGDLSHDKRISFKCNAFKAFEDWIKDLNSVPFDEWHKKSCENMIKSFSLSCDIDNSFIVYGQAQKLVNMTLKYVYVLDDDNKYGVKDIFDCLHVPVDKYILELAKKYLGINQPDGAWSTWNYNTYKEYQEELRKKIKVPMRWEMQNWILAKEEKV